jgi:hypothetical protein
MSGCEGCELKDTDRCFVKTTGELADVCPDYDNPRKHKCFFDMKGIFHPCPGATAMLEYCAPKLEIRQLINMKNGEERDLGIVIPSTKKHKGLVLNFCPFCQQKVCNHKDDQRTENIPYYEAIKDEQSRKELEE